MLPDFAVSLVMHLTSLPGNKALGFYQSFFLFQLESDQKCINNLNKFKVMYKNSLVSGG